jgi:hypothetical protein
MLGGLPLYDPFPSFSLMVAKAAVRSATDIDREPCWPIPKGSYRGGACGAETDDILVYSMVMSIFKGLTMMSLYVGLVLLVIVIPGNC